ncbi:carboxymuconolactone decarboxylase family protein [Microbacterium luticocti]|uniref:carboxymuconolactone decarboxylase family protein n=1 Tax=Microbacterium luticocti TaxID=451764 RepID=UPI0003FB1EB4|nr:carboxymuconolactone decarboxylase family protein [Microbacterium luticocti]
MVSERMVVASAFPEGFRAVLGLEKAVHTGPVDDRLITLVKLRASQINGCAYCMNMHAGEARAAGESNRRLDVLRAWREVDDLYSERERAALALTEEVTLISHGGVSDEVWDAASAVFDATEMAQLLTAIATINVWNRLAISTHQQPED